MLVNDGFHDVAVDDENNDDDDDDDDDEDDDDDDDDDDWRLRGCERASPQPGNRFVSFVRASGRGEAKLRGRAGDDEFCVARAPAGQLTSRPRPTGRSWLGCHGGCHDNPAVVMTTRPFRAGLSRRLS